MTRGHQSLLALGALLSCATAAAGDASALRIGVAGAPPFVTESEPPRGLSIEVWQALAARTGLAYELVPVPTVQGAVDQVARGELDAAIGPISITAERARQVSFTQPYFQGSLSILAPPSGPNLFARVGPFLSRAFFFAIGGLLFVLVLVGALVWAAERRHNPSQFPSTPVRGVGAGVWLALVTMTTVGFGDKAPVTLAGRLVVGAWMLVSMLTASSLTAGIATALTLSQLDRPAIGAAEDLADRRVAVVRGTTSVAFAEQYRARVEQAPTLEDAVARLLDGSADAVVFDRPMLRHYLSENPRTKAALSKDRYEPQGYGFAVARGSALLPNLNVALLDLAEAGQLASLQRRWLGE